MSPNDLRYKIISGERVSPADMEDYKSLYKFWQENWSDALQELHGKPEKLFSDQFTRQDYHAVIFNDSKAIASTSFRKIIINENTFVDDSYFQCWPKADLSKLTTYEESPLVCSQFGVDKAFRGRNGSTSVKDILFALSLYVFSISDSNWLITTLRADRNMPKLGHIWNAHIVNKDVTSQHKDSVALMLFNKKNVRERFELSENSLLETFNQQFLNSKKLNAA